MLYEIWDWIKGLTLKQWLFLIFAIILFIMMTKDDQPGYDEWGGEHVPHKTNRPQPNFQDE